MAVSARGSRGIAGRLETAFVRLNQWVVVAMMGSMAALVFANVVARYLFTYSIIWVEEITQYEMIWITYLGAGLASEVGMQVTVLSPAEIEPFRKLAQPPVREWAEKEIGKDYVDRLVTAVAAGKK